MIEYRWVWLTPVKFRFTNHFIWGFQKSHTGFWRYCKPLPGCKWTHVWTPKHVGRVWTWWQLYSIGNKQIHQWILGYPYTNHMFNEHSPLFWWNRPRLVDICSCKTPQPNMHRMDQDGMCRCIAHFLWNGGGFIVGRCWMQKLGLSEIFGNHNKLPIVYKLMFPSEIAKKSWDIWFFILARPNVLQETMSPGLNELLLWHGTSEWGATWLDLGATLGGSYQ